VVTDAERTRAAVMVERAVLLPRIAVWRFLATDDASGPDIFRASL
jgi:hypothetical protein